MGRIARRIRRGARTEQGAVAVIVALCAVALLISAAIVLDFGLVRVERQSNKSAADSAVMAGLRAEDKGTDSIYNALGVCAALQYLKADRRALSGLPDTLETPAAGSCAAPDATQVCVPSADPNPTQVTYHATTMSGTTKYEVWIKSPYRVTDATTGGPAFSEESTASATAGKAALQGCDQLGVVIKEWTKPGLGQLVSSQPIVTRLRSVGRLAIGPGDQAPALLLLDSSHCQVLALSAGGGGADSHIRVYGSEVYMAKRKDGTPGLVDTAGSIHADTDASNCAAPLAPPVFVGSAADGIVAYGPPDQSSSGTITSLAALNGAPVANYDSSAKVYGTTAKNEVSVGTKTAPSGHGKVTRKVVDNRYLGQTTTPPSTGVAGAMADAQAQVFGSVTAGNAVAKGWKLVSSCNPGASDLTGITAATPMVFIDCATAAGYKGSLPIHGQQVAFSGQIASSATVSLPDAQKVYVFGYSGNGIDASNGFSMHTVTSSGVSLIDPATGKCQDAPTPAKATLFVKDGGINANGGVLQLCNTTVFLMGNRPNGCVTSIQYVFAPFTTPCGGGAGNGLIKIAGTATQDWTAPNKYNDMSAFTDDQRTAEWTDKNGPEDLALWSESYGTSSNWQMSGGGAMHLTGVFMTPNAWPFVVKGGAAQSLSNAQYVASSFLLTGGATLTMKVDANNVISFPMLNPFSLVR